jgi:hypothetical protein
MTVIGSRCEGALLYFAAVRWPQLTARWIGFTSLKERTGSSALV